MPNIIERPQGGALVVEMQLMPILPAIETALACRQQWFDLPSLAGHYPAMVERAIEIRTAMLPDRPMVERAEGELRMALRQQITPQVATAMLAILFDSQGRKPNESAESYLRACVSMFVGDAERIGALLGLWRMVPNQPVVVALAIERLFRKQVFAPQPPELRAACHLAHEKVENAWRAAYGWLTTLRDAEELLKHFAPVQLQISDQRRAAAYNARSVAKRGG